MRNFKTIRTFTFFVLIFTLICLIHLSKHSILNINYLFTGMLILLGLLFKIHFDLEKKYNALKQESRIIKQIFENAPEALFYKDKYLKYQGANKAFLETWNLSAEKLKGKSDINIYPEYIKSEIRQNEIFVLQNKVALSDEKHIKTKDTEKYYELARIPLLSEDGNIVGLAGISRDITRLKLTERELLKKQSQLKGILDNMPYVAYLKDLSGNIVCSNKKYRELLHSISEMDNGEDFLSEVSNQFSDNEEKVIKEQKTITFEKRIRTKNIEIWFEVHKAPLFDNSNNVCGIVVTSKEISAQKEVEQQKELFVATLTHDLKTPTTAQMRALELFEKGILGPLNKDQKEIAHQVYNSCKYMNNMIGTVLASYKFDYGQVKLTPEIFDIVELAEECNKELLFSSEEKNIRVNIKSSDTEITISADKLNIKRVIMNLLGNAMAYSRHDSTVDIYVSKMHDFVRLEVVNISEYLSPSELERIFKKYISKAEKYNKAGTGLGLYLSKQIIDAHGGRMIAKSNENKINTFGFELNINKFADSESVEVTTI